jgi:hypothetical protein
MRRQLRAQGGIMNVAPREKFGIGSTFQKFKDKAIDRTRKIIPNELADVAVKAAPFVAMIPGGAPYAAAMRGLGRLDQRGDLMDALKQGALTYGFGEYVAPSIREGLGGLRDRASNFFQGAEKPLTKGNPNFTGGNANTGNIIGGSGTTGTPIPKKGLIETGTDFLSDKVPGFGKLNQIVQEKLLVGGVTGAATYIYEKFIADYPDPEPGQDMEQYLAERKERVGAQMRTYMDNYFANQPEYMQLDDAGRDAFVARYNVRDGGRIGYQTGGVTMGSTLQQNIASNRQQAAGIQAMLNAARAKAGLPTVQAPQQTAAPAQTTPATSITKTVKPISTSTQMIGAPMGARQLTQAPTMQQISSAMLSPMKKSLGISPSVSPVKSSLQGIPMPFGAPPSGSAPMALMPQLGGYTPEQFDKLSQAQQNKIMDDERIAMDKQAFRMTPFYEQTRMEPQTQLKILQERGFDTSKLYNQQGDLDVDKLVLTKLRTDLQEQGVNLTGNETPNELLELEEEQKRKIMKEISESPMFDPYSAYDRLTYTGPTDFQLTGGVAAPMATGGRVGFEEGGTNFMKWLKANYGLEVKDLDMDEYSKLSREYNNENPDPYETGRKKNAGGGIMSMPMGQPRVNQGGVTELDYRAKGGFVPVGIKEKADDVPAMLSKNEFVFTADAVRGAGNGSIEKGAQKMYDTMKNLERRVT